jgi:hypothetical protein
MSQLQHAVSQSLLHPIEERPMLQCLYSVRFQKFYPLKSEFRATSYMRFGLYTHDIVFIYIFFIYWYQIEVKMLLGEGIGQLKLNGMRKFINEI